MIRKNKSLREGITREQREITWFEGKSWGSVEKNAGDHEWEKVVAKKGESSDQIEGKPPEVENDICRR